MPAQSPKHQDPTQSAPTTTTTNLPVPTPLPPIAHEDTSSPSTTSKPHPKDRVFPNPKLRLEIRDLNHSGTNDFLTSVNASEALQKAAQSVLTLLYQSPSTPNTTVPPTRSVTLVLRSMPGVAYTTGSDLDEDHKEIHFSLEYISGISSTRKGHEILGVLTHEMVHCYQYNAFGSCPGGLIEGIADWVRLNAGLGPPHWTRDAKGNWDGGYQHTGYFLEYLEKRFGEGLVRRINDKLRNGKYDEKKFWTGICGAPVKQLWGDYAKWLEKGEEDKSIEDDISGLELK